MLARCASFISVISSIDDSGQSLMSGVAMALGPRGAKADKLVMCHLLSFWLVINIFLT
ncbi:hypothetical protein N9Y17_04195 [Gammaproteobacteria bacterium]|nr:hypothetical protein [Gammaproteobacteria bacterium]